VIEEFPCVESLEIALARRGFTFYETRDAWILYPRGNAAGKAVVVAQEQLMCTLVFERKPLMREIDAMVEKVRD
jgi:hypothetical protein